jgi:hypothetical protein
MVPPFYFQFKALATKGSGDEIAGVTGACEENAGKLNAA